MGKSIANSIICAILLNAVFEQVDGQSNCINLAQDGESVIYENTTLVCSILPASYDHSELRWYTPHGVPTYAARIWWHSDVPDITVTDPYKYDCQWDADEQQSVLTIKNIAISDDGSWRCRYYGLCFEEERFELDVTGMLFKSIHLFHKPLVSTVNSIGRCDDLEVVMITIF